MMDHKTKEFVFCTTNLSKQYKNCLALKDVCMNIPKGAIYGLVGKNGAGKTTLMRIISGLQEPTECQSIQKEPTRVGAVIETPAVYMNMTARDNLMVQCKLRSIARAECEQEIDRLLTLVGLQNTGKKKAGQFSLGMRQRLGIAIALVGNPEFLILDEPINGLDPEGIIEMRKLLLKLNQEMHITILMSSHILGELSKLATHYGFIKNGKIIKEISAKELQNRDEGLENFYMNLMGGKEDA